MKLTSHKKITNSSIIQLRLAQYLCYKNSDYRDSQQLEKKGNIL